MASREQRLPTSTKDRFDSVGYRQEVKAQVVYHGFLVEPSRTACFAKQTCWVREVELELCRGGCEGGEEDSGEFLLSLHPQPIGFNFETGRVVCVLAASSPTKCGNHKRFLARLTL